MTTAVKEFPLTARLATPGAPTVTEQGEDGIILANPSAPTVTPQGTGGVGTWTYKIVAINADGQHTAASAGGSTAVGNATLDVTNFNRITWSAVVGAVTYDVYRTAVGVSPSDTGLIATGLAVLTLDDDGLAGDSATAPATNNTDVGVTTWTYKVVAVNADGQRTNAGATGSTTSGARTLNGTNFNRLTWSAVTDAVSYDIYRTVAGGASPTTTGRIATALAAVTLDDTGLAGDGGTAPSTNSTGGGDGTISVLHMENKSVQVSTFVGTVQLEGTIDGATWENAGAAIVNGGFADVARTYALMRATVTAYTSGTPRAFVAGHGRG